MSSLNQDIQEEPMMSVRHVVTGHGKPFSRPFIPTPKGAARPRFAEQRVVGFIGVPGSGKSTLAAQYEAPAWVTLTLDDFRQTMWPPNRRVYWEKARTSEMGHASQRLLHAVQETALTTALYEGFNVVLPDTHIRLSAFRRELEIVADHGITIEWKIFKVPLDELIARNIRRGQVDPSHQVPNDVLLNAYRDLWAPDAWWRWLPMEHLELIEHNGSDRAA